MGNPAEHVAVITWDCGPRGIFPVARSHNEWLAAGMFALPSRNGTSDSTMLSTLSPATFAGLATGLVPWLMTGDTLALHQAFDATVFGVQVDRHAVSHVVLPAVAFEAAQRDGLLNAETIASIVAVHRRPDVDLWLAPASERLKDLAVFGEIGLLPLLRGENTPPRLPLGPVPVQFEGGATAVETALDSGGTLAVRGAHIPRAAFPGNDLGDKLPINGEAWVSTGYPASLDGGSIVIDGPRRDLVSIGGQSLALAAIESIYGDVPGAISVNAAAVPDRILGQRLTVEAMPQPGAELTVVSLVMHAEGKSVTPLAMTADALVGDRRRNSRLAGAA
jgi:acyl-CoA synthetase (AMP-forming)/AMP-acid ligase II